MLEQRLGAGTPKRERGIAYAAPTIADLAALYEPSVEVVVHTRTASAPLERLVRDKLCVRAWEQSLRLVADGRSVPNIAPWCDADTTLFAQDIAAWAEVYAQLMDSPEVGVRITCTATPPCPRFHVDRVGARMVCTYAGAGTEWLLSQHVRREKLGHAAGGLSDEQSGLIQGPVGRMHTFDIGLLKGEGWFENLGMGLVHRSPPTSGVENRLFVSFDAL